MADSPLRETFIPSRRGMGCEATSMNEEQEKIVALCKSFVGSMVQVETAITTMHERMPKAERQECLKAILRWVETSPEIPANTYARELAREILGQLSASAFYEDYAGSVDSYIQ